jgi:hypothetical protein
MFLVCLAVVLVYLAGIATEKLEPRGEYHPICALLFLFFCVIPAASALCYLWAIVINAL